jgi:hypothetical protein
MNRRFGTIGIVGNKTKTVVVPDYSQLELLVINDVCNKCKSNFRSEIISELKGAMVECNCCGHLQIYRSGKQKVKL